MKQNTGATIRPCFVLTAGGEMRHKTVEFSHVLFHFFECERGTCGGTSPEHLTLEEAYKAATKRASCWISDENHVLTLEEVKDAYFNTEKPICCELMWRVKKKIAWIADAAFAWGNVAHIVERQEPKWKEYGVTWRCWLRHPTKQEMAETPWEGEKNER